ncbi:hypothetical protein BD414DRAFT_387648, partial [Trametes punicea]
DYDAFAYDVACLGNLYRAYLWVRVALSIVHLLAPLFDRMTTHLVSERFTASDAADFIDTAIGKWPDALLDVSVISSRNWQCCINPDLYWSRTPVDFLAKWSHYRMPGMSRTARILDSFSVLPVGWTILRF